MDFDDSFDLEKVEVCVEKFRTGVQLQCGWGDDILAAPIFSREDDAESWKDFIEYTINRAVHGDHHDDYDAVVAERDSLSDRVDDLLAEIQSLRGANSVLESKNNTFCKSVSSLKDKVALLSDSIDSMMDASVNRTINTLFGEDDDLIDVIDEVHDVRNDYELTDNQDIIFNSLPQMTTAQARRLYDNMFSEHNNTEAKSDKTTVLESYPTMVHLCKVTDLSYHKIYFELYYHKDSLFNVGLIHRIYAADRLSAPVMFYIAVDDGGITSEEFIANSVVDSEVDFVAEPDVSVGVKSEESLINCVRVLKIFGNNFTQANAKMSVDLRHSLRAENLKYRELCTVSDSEFIKMFGRPLFDDNSYMGSHESLVRQNVLSFLMVDKLKMIQNDASEYTIEDIADELGVHPAYIWAVCIEKGIPFMMAAQSD